MLLLGTGLLVLDLIYLAVSECLVPSHSPGCRDLTLCSPVARYFSGAPNKVGGGFAVLGLYMFGTIYCKSVFVLFS